MKIGIVCYPTYGGSGVIATELGKKLAQSGNEIHFITYRQPVRLDVVSENVLYHEVGVADYPLFEFPPYEAALTSMLVDVVKFHKLNVLHVHYAIPHASAAYLAKQILKEEGIDVPIVTTLHGTDITLVGKDAAYEPVVTFAINHSDAVTAVSESLRKDTFKHFNISNEITVIPNFIDLKRFSKQAKEHFRQAIAPHGEKLIIHTSNFRKVKRGEDVIRIFEIIHKSIPSKLLLLGDGPERNHLEKLCRESEACHDIRFLGKQEAVEEVLSVCDLFLLPSESESFGLAALEAMACQVPVISSDAGGIPELNIHGETGYISTIGDVEDMGRNAIRLLSDAELLKSFKRNSLARAKTFDIEKILPMYMKVYSSVTGS